MDSGFFKLLAAYAPISQNEASYDEHVSKLASRLGVEEIKIDNGLFRKLLDSFNTKPRPIIISGSAGDGKTNILRMLFENLNGDSSNSINDYIPQVIYKDIKIKFIKDFTEIENNHKVSILSDLYKSINNNSKEIYFIAANDGKLTDTLREYLKENESFNELLQLIEKHINDPTYENDLILLDLSQTSSAKNFDLLLNKILYLCDHYEGNCPSLSNIDIFCPIHSNINLLKQKHVQKQLMMIIKSCDFNSNHITLRKLFMLIANMILGYKGEKKVFNSCEMAIEHYKSPKEKTDASFYNNIFAENLTKSKQEQSPFRELRELRIGNETTNNIDNFILFGDMDNNLSTFHTRILANPFFDFKAFNRTKENYLNNSETESRIKIQSYLVFLRRHLFFNYDDELDFNKKIINSRDLIAYKHAEHFYNNIITPLKKGKNVDKSIIKELALGLNRVFLGELVSKDANSQLYIATSLTGTMSKLSSEVLTSIIFNQKHLNQDIRLKLINGFDDEYCMVYLEIIFEGKPIANLELDLHMFEFLKRIEEGILPTSFSVEYYERVLTFKSQIVNYVLKHEETDGDFQLFTLDDSNGTLQYINIQVKEGYVRES